MRGHLVTLDFLPFKEYGFTGVIINDVTERKQIEEELKLAKDSAERANSAKSHFLATMSHELRTPLNHIIGFAELLVDNKLGELNSTQQEYLTDILESGMHLLALVNDILDLSKVEAGKMELNLAVFDLESHLENCSVVVKEKAMQKGIEVKLDIAKAPATVKADERKFRQIIYNLLSNAIKFTPEGGEICLSAKIVDRIVRPGQRQADAKDLKIILDPVEGVADETCRHQNCVEITVSDTGIGIAPDEIDRIFKPFEQIQDAQSNRPKGTGLGLSLTKSLVELHGGRIWVESQGPEKGSRFSFIMPV
jgi:signal transduction histidine kinase